MAETQKCKDGVGIPVPKHDDFFDKLKESRYAHRTIQSGIVTLAIGLEIGTANALGRAMGEIAEQLKRRTMRFSLDVCALIRQLPVGEPGWTVQHQLTKAATSVAFNYRAACRGRSHAEYTAKIGLVSEEADESLGWLEFVEAAELLQSEELHRLLAEARELSAIMSASYGTARYKERDKRRGERSAHGQRPV